MMDIYIVYSTEPQMEIMLIPTLSSSRLCAEALIDTVAWIRDWTDLDLPKGRMPLPG